MFMIQSIITRSRSMEHSSITEYYHSLKEHGTQQHYRVLSLAQGAWNTAALQSESPNPLSHPTHNLLCCSLATLASGFDDILSALLVSLETAAWWHCSTRIGIEIKDWIMADIRGRISSAFPWFLTSFSKNHWMKRSEGRDLWPSHPIGFEEARGPELFIFNLTFV
jgi:hypothetical protein